MHTYSCIVICFYVHSISLDGYAKSGDNELRPERENGEQGDTQ